MSETEIIKVPKIKKRQVLSKLMIDPSQIKKGLPQSSLPQLTDKGMILSLTPQTVPLAKLSNDGTLKIQLKYNAEIIELIGKYIEVVVQDNYDDFWVGNLFGKTVKGEGKGEQNSVKGCKVVGIQGQTIIVKGVSEGENQIWKKLQTRIQEILDKNN